MKPTNKDPAPTPVSLLWPLLSSQTLVPCRSTDDLPSFSSYTCLLYISVCKANFVVNISTLFPLYALFIFLLSLSYWSSRFYTFLYFIASSLCNTPLPLCLHLIINFLYLYLCLFIFRSPPLTLTFPTTASPKTWWLWVPSTLNW